MRRRGHLVHIAISALLAASPGVAAAASPAGSVEVKRGRLVEVVRGATKTGTSFALSARRDRVVAVVRGKRRVRRPICLVLRYRRASIDSYGLGENCGESGGYASPALSLSMGAATIGPNTPIGPILFGFAILSAVSVEAQFANGETVTRPTVELPRKWGGGRVFAVATPMDGVAPRVVRARDASGASLGGTLFAGG